MKLIDGSASTCWKKVEPSGCWSLWFEGLDSYVNMINQRHEKKRLGTAPSRNLFAIASITPGYRCIPGIFVGKWHQGAEHAMNQHPTRTVRNSKHKWAIVSSSDRFEFQYVSMGPANLSLQHLRGPRSGVGTELKSEWTSKPLPTNSALVSEVPHDNVSQIRQSNDCTIRFAVWEQGKTIWNPHSISKTLSTSDVWWWNVASN